MSDGPAVVVDGLVKRYGARTAVNGLSLQVRRGEVFALLGPYDSDDTRGGFTVTAVGTHHELLDTSPQYRSLLSQSSDLEPAR